MSKTSLSPIYRVPFYLVNSEAVRLLDEYLCGQMKEIPHPMRFNIINMHNDNNLRCFLNLYHKNFLDNYEKRVSDIFLEYKELEALHEFVLLIIGAVTSSALSKENFTLRCTLIAHHNKVPGTYIIKYLKDRSLKFHLFGCLHEIINTKLELPESQKEILKYVLCYSNKYKKLTTTELAKKRNVSNGSIRHKKNQLISQINDLIRTFKVLAPYNSYRYRLNAKLIKIGPKVFDSIRRKEGVAEMTDAFIAKVLSVIYNYEVSVSHTGERAEYLLTHRGITKNKLILFGKHNAERNIL